MRGRYVSATWGHDPTLYAPPKYRKPASTTPSGHAQRLQPIHPR